MVTKNGAIRPVDRELGVQSSFGLRFNYSGASAAPLPALPSVRSTIAPSPAFGSAGGTLSERQAKDVGLIDQVEAGGLAAVLARLEKPVRSAPSRRNAAATSSEERSVGKE